jgi:nitrogen regulatory protein P-II 1
MAMKRIQALVRPDRLDALRAVLEKACVRSITVNSVRYRGPETRPLTAFRGYLIPEDYVEKLEIDMVVQDDDVDRIVALILSTARTAASDDGHVSVSPIDHRYSIHTGYREIC